MKRANIIAVCVMFVAFVNGACEKESPAPPTQATPKQKKSAPPAAADPAKDDPATPAWLPDPDEIPGWVRTSNIEVVRPGEITDPRDKLTGSVQAFSFKSMFYFKYQSTLPEPGGVIAAVSLVELNRRDGAYGLATCMMPIQPRDSLVGSMSSVENYDGSTTVHGWQGRFYILATMKHGSVPEPRVSLEKLAAALLRPIPSAEPPVSLSYLPKARRIPGRTWVACKHLGVLPPELQSDALRGSAVETTKALGLGADTVMAIVAYDPGDGESPNYIWLVEYPTHQDAISALGRYKNTLRKIKPMPLVLMDMARDADGKPVGRYLCGTWTADQESIMNLLPVIADRLPK